MQQEYDAELTLKALIKLETELNACLFQQANHSQFNFVEFERIMKEIQPLKGKQALQSRLSLYPIENN